MPPSIGISVKIMVSVYGYITKCLFFYYAENRVAYGAMTTTEEKKARWKLPTVTKVFDDGRMLELVYEPSEHKTSFVVWDKKEWRFAESIELQGGQQLVPYSPHNNLIRNAVVSLPSCPEEYGTEEELVSSVAAFIYKYVDISPSFLRITAYYVLFSWIYDSFHELPYLRLRGDYGSGKTRFLQVVGSICNRGFFASGASTLSPVFHILDAFRGTLVIDEADFRYSDMQSEMVKLFNVGTNSGMPLLRCEVVGNREFNPRAFHVYGPKLIAMRGVFEDRALESRCLTEEMGQRKLRDDIPINLPPEMKTEALRLKNQLLLYRFRTFGKKKPDESLIDANIEPRLKQMFIPLMSIVGSAELQKELRQLAREYQREIVLDRGMDAVEAQVLEVIRDLWLTLEKKNLPIKDITAAFTKKYRSEYEKLPTNRMIGRIVRRKLQIKTVKAHGIYAVPWSEQPKLKRLYEKYGIDESEPEGPMPEEIGQAPDESGARVDSGDIGDTIQEGESGEGEGE